jgi:hypothetical protein
MAGQERQMERLNIHKHSQKGCQQLRLTLQAGSYIVGRDTRVQIGRLLPQTASTGHGCPMHTILP